MCKRAVLFSARLSQHECVGRLVKWHTTALRRKTNCDKGNVTVHDCDSVIGVNSNTPPRTQSHLQLVSATGPVTNTQQTCTSQLSNKTLAITRLGSPMLLVRTFRSRKHATSSNASFLIRSIQIVNCLTRQMHRLSQNTNSCFKTE